MFILDFVPIDLVRRQLINFREENVVELMLGKSVTSVCVVQNLAATVHLGNAEVSDAELELRPSD